MDKIVQDQEDDMAHDESMKHKRHPTNQGSEIQQISAMPIDNNSEENNEDYQFRKSEFHDFGLNRRQDQLEFI